jgi:4-aminobutyrate aminotransferase/(S)-3-amino-2-methylpropionate transaminase
MSSIFLRTKIPGPQSRRLFQDREKHIPKAVFQVTPIFAARAHGAILEDVDGNRFIDFAGGIGSLNAGHTPHEVVEAIQEQSEHFIHTCFHVTMHRPYVELAEKLNSLTPGKFPKKTFFVNSGAEAVENAVKLARYYTKRPAIVAFEHGYHGRTLLTMSLTSKVRPYKYGFGPFAPEIYRLPYPYLYHRPSTMTEKEYIRECLERTRSFFKTHVAPDQVAGVVFELVTGEGGFIVMPPAYVQGLAEICREHKILVIADEVQTGFGRTGKTFACDHHRLIPDLMILAKSLASGMPLAAVTGRSEIMDAVHVGGLGGTFGGNPLSCASALATLKIFQRDRLDRRAQEIGKRVMKHLRPLQKKCRFIGEIRGLGAMVGIELVTSRSSREPATQLTARIQKKCIERGLIILTAGVHSNIIRTLMPLTITNEQLDEGLGVLSKALLEGSC